MSNPQVLSIFLAILLIGSIITIVIPINQKAEALAAATFTPGTTFTDFNGVWEQVYKNTAGTATYFIDSSASSFKSVKVNNDGTIAATVSSSLLAGPIVSAGAHTASSTKNDARLAQGFTGSTEPLRTTTNTFMTELANGATGDMVGQVVNEIDLRLKKTGAPTGTAIIAVFDSTGATVCQFGTQNVASLTTSFVTTTFTKTTGAPCTIASGHRIGTFFNGGSAGNTYDVEYVAADRYDGTLSYVQTATGAQGAAIWTDQTARDIYFELSYNHLASLTNDLVTSSTWENSGFVNRAMNTLFDASTTIRSGSITIVTEKIVGGQLSGASYDQWDLFLSKTGSPTGTATVGRFNSAGVIQDTCNTIDVSTLTTTAHRYSFLCPDDDTLTATTYFGIEYTGGDASNNVQVYRMSLATYDGTNAILTTFTAGVPTDSSTQDMAFRVVDNPAGDQEASAFIKANLGSSLTTTGVRVYFPDATKIPETVIIATSPDDAIYTTQLTVNPDQVAGIQTFQWATLNTQYIRMTVSVYGASDNSMEVSDFNRLYVNAGISQLSEVIETGSIRYVYYTQRESVAAELIEGAIDIDTGEVYYVTEVVTGGIVSEVVDTVVSKNKVYSIWRDLAGGSNTIVVSSWLLDLTSFTALEDDVAIANAVVNGDCEMATDGATEATDSFYCVLGYAGANAVKVTEYNGATIVVIATPASSNTATDIELTDLSDKQAFNFVSAGTTRTYTITKSGDVVSAELYAESWLSRETQQFNFDLTTRTYKSSTLSKLYMATASHPIAYSTAGVLTDPDTCYVETVIVATSTFDCVDDTNYYRVSDTLIVSGVSTTWTPRVITANALAPTVYEENLNVDLLEDYSIINDDVVTIQCDAQYVIQGRINYVGDVSDCEQWHILDTTINPIGRELPFALTSAVVHTEEYTNYNIHVTIVSGSAEDYDAQIVYEGVDVDRNHFDSSDNVQLRLLFGQCYTLEYILVLSGEVVQSSTMCADDVIFKEDVITTGLGFTFSSAPWAGTHRYNETSFILTTIVHHDPAPYNYTRNIVNGTGHTIDSQSFNATDEFDIQQYNATLVAQCDDPNFDQTPLKVQLFNEDDRMFYDQYFENCGDYLSPLKDLFDENIGEFAGWGLLLFLPIIFASIFTRNTAGIGGGFIMAFIGVIVVFGLISIPESAIWLMVFVAVIGILAYKILKD